MVCKSLVHKEDITTNVDDMSRQFVLKEHQKILSKHKDVLHSNLEDANSPVMKSKLKERFEECVKAPNPISQYFNHILISTSQITYV